MCLSFWAEKLFVLNPRSKPYLFKGDHKFPTLNEAAPVVILYAEMGTKDFATFHKVLSEKAQKEEIVYVLRHFVQVSGDVCLMIVLAG